MESSFRKWFEDSDEFSPKEITFSKINTIQYNNILFDCDPHNVFLPMECNIMDDQHLSSEEINNLISQDPHKISFPEYEYEVNEVQDTFAEHQLKSVEDFIQSYKACKPQEIPNNINCDDCSIFKANEQEKQWQESTAKSNNFIFSTKNSEIENKLSINDKISDSSIVLEEPQQPKLRVRIAKPAKEIQQQCKPKKRRGGRVPKKSKRSRISKPTISKLDSTKAKDLSKRKDVVNKTLLRSLKRYFSNLFKDNYDDYLLSKKSEINSFICENGSKLTSASVKTFIEIMISPITSKKKLKKRSDKLMYSNFYSCLYEYSHTKLYELLRMPQLKFLLLDYFKDGMDIMISSDKTLMKNPEVYQEASKRFIDLINN